MTIVYIALAAAALYIIVMTAVDRIVDARKDDE